MIPENGIIELREASTTSPNAVRVADGGWHFGYMGNTGEKDVAKRIGTKVVAAAHQEYNEEEITELLIECGYEVIEIKEKYPNKTIWMYTGDSWESIMHYAIMQYVDVLVDGEFQIDKKDVKLLWKGSSNQRVIDVQKSLTQTDPLIPGLHCGDYA